MRRHDTIVQHTLPGGRGALTEGNVKWRNVEGGCIESDGRVDLAPGHKGLTITTKNGEIRVRPDRTYLGIFLDWCEEIARRWIVPYVRGKR